MRFECNVSTVRRIVKATGGLFVPRALEASEGGEAVGRPPSLLANPRIGVANNHAIPWVRPDTMGPHVHAFSDAVAAG